MGCWYQFADGHGGSVVLTGPVTIDEFTIRASVGAFLFVPPGVNENAVAAAGLTLKLCENRTQATAEIAHRQYAARESRSSELMTTEGTDWYLQRQRFLAMTAELASSGRLSRFLYVAKKPHAIQS